MTYFHEEIASFSARTEADKLVKIGLITVNYNSAEATARLLSDILRQDLTRCRLCVVVADNSAAAGDLAQVCEAFRDNASILFLPFPSNPGYFGAAHQAFQQTWTGDPPDWLIVANPDIRILQPGFFTRVAELPPTRGAIIGPRIVSARTGLDQNPFHHRRPSNSRMNFVRFVLRVPLLRWLLVVQSRFRSRLRACFRRTARLPRSEPLAIYAPHGSFVIFNREYFGLGADLNVGSFLYAEEIYVAESCRRLGMKVVWEPALEVLHEEHVSISLSTAVRRFQVESADYCYREFFSSARDLRMKG